MKNLPRFLHLTLLAGLAATLLLLSGCATPSQPAPLTQSDFTPQNRHASTVEVKVTGGSETSAAGASQISNQAFAEALTKTINESKVFAGTGGTDSKYTLEVHIVALQQPMFGGTFTVQLETNWRLLDRATGNPVWQQGIRSSGTATMGEAFVGVTRLRLANEAAARANIRDALTQISALTLP